MRKLEKQVAHNVLDGINNELKDYDDGIFAVISYKDIDTQRGNIVKLQIRDRTNGMNRDSREFEFKIMRCVMPDGTKQLRISNDIYNWVADFIINIENKKAGNNGRTEDG